jgi:hypothetical protein
MQSVHPPWHALLHQLATQSPASPTFWESWEIAPVGGGANNLLYRITGPVGMFAVKFAIRDERDRAGREAVALQAVQDAGLPLAPRLVLLDRDTYSQPVVVQTWLDGEALTTPPNSDAEWSALAAHYAVIHTITPARASHALRPAVLNATSGTAGKALVCDHAQRLPLDARPPELAALLDAFEAWEPPTWPEPPPVLCRVDSNYHNFIARPGGWASVDWENSGWGDGAFELADLVTHPAYEDVPAERWAWVVEQYVAMCGDVGAARRIAAYILVMRVWWVVRLARYLYEVPHGLDARLAPRAATWHEETTARYERYLDRARRALEAAHEIRRAV